MTIRQYTHTHKISTKQRETKLLNTQNHTSSSSSLSTWNYYDGFSVNLEIHHCIFLHNVLHSQASYVEKCLCSSWHRYKFILNENILFDFEKLHQTLFLWLFILNFSLSGWHNDHCSTNNKWQQFKCDGNKNEYFSNGNTGMTHPIYMYFLRISFMSSPLFCKY